MGSILTENMWNELWEHSLQSQIIYKATRQQDLLVNKCRGVFENIFKKNLQALDSKEVSYWWLHENSISLQVGVCRLFKWILQVEACNYFLRGNHRGMKSSHLNALIYISWLGRSRVRPIHHRLCLHRPLAGWLLGGSSWRFSGAWVGLKRLWSFCGPMDPRDAERCSLISRHLLP